MLRITSMLLRIALTAAVAGASGAVNLTALDTSFQPQSAWQTRKESCGTVYSTTTNGANVAFSYTGNSLFLSGFSNASSGVIELQVDGVLVGQFNLSSTAGVSCDLLVGWSSTSQSSGAHKATLSLVDSGIPTRFDLSGITYDIVTASNVSSTCAPVNNTNTTSGGGSGDTMNSAARYYINNGILLGAVASSVVGATVSGLFL